MTWTRRGFAAACALVTTSALAVGGALPAAATDTSPTPTPAASATAAPQAEQKGPIGGPGLAGGGIHVHYDPDATHLPAVWAKSWVLADLTSGDVLAAKSPHLKRPPASTLKTLTAVTLIPQLDPKSKYRAVYSDVAVEGSRAGIVDGATYTVDNLFYGLFLPSGNDAAHALANANGGVKHTIKQMNAEARHLQALDTTAKTPHGLDTPGQVSSAYDLALIARAGMQLPAFRTYVSTLHHPFPGQMPKHGKKRWHFQLWNQNRLLQDGYRGVLGIKTGYTTLAGRTFVAAAKRGNRTLVVTLMGITEPSEAAARKLLDWGFKHGDEVTPVGTLVNPLPPKTATQPAAQPGQSVQAAGPLGAVPVTPSEADGISLWPIARWVGLALLVVGAVVALLSVRGRRREARSRQRLMAAARRTR